MASEAQFVFVMAPSFGDEPGGVQQFTREVVGALRGEVGAGRLIGLSYADPSPSADGFHLRRDVGNSRIRQVNFLWDALWICARFRPRLIFSVYPSFAPVCWICSRVFGIPYVVVAHGIEVWGEISRGMRFGLRRADWVLPVSEFTARCLIDRHGVEARRVLVFSNTVDTHRFCPGARVLDARARFGFGRDQRLLLTVARLDPSEKAKGLEAIWAVMAGDDGLAGVGHLVIGDGADRERLENEVERLGLKGRVIFVGRVAADELPAWYREADLFVMPSEKEGFGIVYLEALATGVAVVARDAGGVSDALLGGKLGWLVKSNRIEDLGAAIKAGLTADPLIDPRANGSFLRRQVETRFGIAAFRERIRNLLAEVGI